MRADIHDGPEQMLQSKAGYIDARPLTASSAKPLATHGRTIHWGQTLHFDGRPASSDFTSTSDLSLHRANRRDVPKANVGVIIVRQLFDPGAAGQWTTLQA